MAHYGKSPIFVFEDYFARIDTIFHLAGGWALGYHYVGFWDFPDFS